MMKILKERSLSRFMAHLENGDAILIISGCRNKNSRSLNNLNTESIRMAALKNRFSYNKVKGGYEEDGNVPVFEESSIIYAPKEREEELYEFGKRWGSHCKQEAVFFVHSNGNSELLYTKRTEEEDKNHKITIHKKFEKVRMGKFHPRQLGAYFTQIKSKRFSFADILNEHEYTEDDVLPSTRRAYNWHDR